MSQELIIPNMSDLLLKIQWLSIYKDNKKHNGSSQIIKSGNFVLAMVSL